MDKVITILNKSYRYNRKLTDKGGYVCVIDTIDDILYLKKYIWNYLVKEFSYVIYRIDNEIYNLTLYLLSSDYSITVIIKN